MFTDGLYAGRAGYNGGSGNQWLGAGISRAMSRGGGPPGQRRQTPDARLLAGAGTCRILSVHHHRGDGRTTVDLRVVVSGPVRVVIHRGLNLLDPIQYLRESFPGGLAESIPQEAVNKWIHTAVGVREGVGDDFVDVGSLIFREVWVVLHP